VEHTRFVHLHTHSEYSLLDGAVKIKTLLEKAHELKMPALAITDHGNMFGAIQFYQQAYKIGVKPIIGCELYIAPGSRFDKAQPQNSITNYHGICLVKNYEGYKNLMKLVTIGYKEGFYYKPRVDKEVLAQYSKGLIFLSGCIKGEIPRLILSGQEQKAREVAMEFQKIFGEGNFYLELNSHGLEDEDIVNKHLLGISVDLGIPVVATNDIHYLYKQDAEVHDILLCIQTNKPVSATDRLRFSTDEFYFKSSEEMEELFAQFPEAISNTMVIANQCNLELEFGKLHLPHYKLPESEVSLDEYLHKLCMEGLKKRYTKITDKILDRLNHELQIISQMRYAGYFLIVWDLVNYARQKGIPVGPGRGSAAGSIVSYALGITDIDPLKYNLLFERFLNPDRVSMPDIDIDFCYERRDEVIEYVTTRYGKDNVAQIITFGTMLAKGVIRDVGRALEIPYNEVDKIAKLIPNEPHITLAEALIRVPELTELYKTEGIKHKLIDTAMKLEGLVRHVSTHAAGVVISRESLTNFVPLYREPKNDTIVTQYAKDEIEAIGLLKMDFLGLRTLTLIYNVVNKVKEKRSIDVNMSNIPLDDKKTFELLCEGNTIGVFQLESAGMRELAKRLQPDLFEDIIALVALYRPGPLNSGMVEEFIKSKHGKKIKYIHPKLEPILEETYGVIVYQEQVMQIAVALGGFSVAQADELRRAMAKKIPEKMEKMRELFLNGATKNGISTNTATRIFELMAKFAEYGFNKSHSAAYALIAYQTAYLKAHFPVEFMATLLTSELGNIDKISFYIAECRRMGIDVLPPDINQSELQFTPVGNKIRFGLNGIKNVGDTAIHTIINARKNEPFKSLYDFCKRVDMRIVNKRVIESLINCGAFDSTGAKRAQLIHVLDNTMAIAAAQQQKKQPSLFELFDVEEELEEEYQRLPDIPEWDETKLLKLEKEMIGIYITGHPLAKYEDKFRIYTTSTIARLKEHKNGDIVVIGGIISHLKNIVTKNNKYMAFVTLEDMTGNIEVVFFQDVFNTVSDKLILDTIVLVKGKLNVDNDTLKVFADSIILPTELSTALVTSIHIRLPYEFNDTYLAKLKDVFNKYKGTKPVYIHVPDKPGSEVVILTGAKFRITPSEALFLELEKITGSGTVWFGYNGS
jgi:DNA polymerase-3 subunit alpha